MKLDDKIVLAHKGYFNKESEKHYRENSREVCALSAGKGYIQIIELDLRKSRDDVLYCYHGSTFEYYWDMLFPKRFPEMEEKYAVDSLEEILEVIPSNKSVFLDIKSSSVTADDLLQAFKDREYKEVILGNKSVSFLRKFNSLPQQFVKILNGNIFCNFYNLSKLKADSFKYVEAVLPFQITRSFVRKVEQNGMEFRLAGLFFWSKDSYWRKIQKYGIKHISSDFI